MRKGKRFFKARTMGFQQSPSDSRLADERSVLDRLCRQDQRMGYEL